MTNWRELVAAKNWTGVEDLWPHLEQPDAADLLKELRAIVPMVTIENGMERSERRALPKEVRPKDLMGAATILLLGELEAHVEGDPPLPTAVWRDLKAAAETFLHESSAKAEATQGDIELSRRHHCDEAIERLRSLGLTEHAMLGEMDGPDEQIWLREVIAEVAIDAYLAGRHVQAAWGKGFEQDAVRGESTLRAAAEGGRRRKGKFAEDTGLINAEMDRLIAEGKSVRSAAEILSRRTPVTANAVRQRYKRHRPRKVGT